MCWVFQGKGEEDGGTVGYRGVSSWIYRGNSLGLRAVEYLMMIVDDYSRMGWPYFLKRKSDVPMAFAGFLADINARGTPSIVECI